MPRMLPRPRPTDEDIDPGLLAEFCGLLLDALQIPEIRSAITSIVQPTIPPSVSDPAGPLPPVRIPPTRATSARVPRRRGQR